MDLLAVCALKMYPVMDVMQGTALVKTDAKTGNAQSKSITTIVIVVRKIAEKVCFPK